MHNSASTSVYLATQVLIVVGFMNTGTAKAKFSLTDSAPASCRSIRGSASFHGAITPHANPEPELRGGSRKYREKWKVQCTIAAGCRVY